MKKIEPSPKWQEVYQPPLNKYDLALFIIVLEYVKDINIKVKLFL